MKRSFKNSVRVVGKFTPCSPYAVQVDTTSSGGIWSGLSPFRIGPCTLYYAGQGYDYRSENMENAWQFSKVYKKHVGENGEPTEEWFNWAIGGWQNKRAHRYPMGKGAKPEYSYWDGRKLGYIEARRVIYAPLYRDAVKKTKAFEALLKLYKTTPRQIVLRDWDGYDHDELGMTLTDVLNEPKRKMGHAFVLKAMLTNDPVLEQFLSPPLQRVSK